MLANIKNFLHYSILESFFLQIQAFLPKTYYLGKKTVNLLPFP